MKSEKEIRERIEELKAINGIDYRKEQIEALEWVLEDGNG